MGDTVNTVHSSISMHNCVIQLFYSKLMLVTDGSFLFLQSEDCIRQSVGRFKCFLLTTIPRLSYILTQSLPCFPLAVSGSESGGIFGEVQSVGLNQKVLLQWEFCCFSLQTALGSLGRRRFANLPKASLFWFQQWLKDVYEICISME